jgi:hypothetical protein
MRALLVASAIAVLPGASAGAAVPVHDTAEVVLHASQAYDGSAGTPNPFTSVALTLSVTSPDGRTLAVDGFFDGDGAGGSFGNVWKARLYLDRAGTWSWTASSSDPGMHGASGQVACSGTLPGAFSKGPIVPRGGRPRYYAHADGTPVYVMGKMLDFDSPTPLQRTTMTLFSEALTDADRRFELDYQHELKVNKLAVYVANKGDFGGTEPTTPWVGTKDANDKTRFDLARWRTYDAWTRTMRDEGLVAQLWFYADNSGFGGLSEADRHRLIRYGMARLSAYANVMLVLTAEWDESWSAAQVHAAGDHLQAHNPWRRPASVHGLDGEFAFPDAAWADYMDIQSYILRSHASSRNVGLATRRLARKPVQNEEFAQGYESGLSRIKAWSVFTAGPAGTGSGSYLEFLGKFAAEVPFYRMDPADDLVLAGSAYCLAERGHHYVVFAYQATTFTLDLRGAEGTFEARWYDPLTGIWSDAGLVQGGGTPTWTTPGGDDMAMWVRPRVTPTSPPERVTGLGFVSRTTLDWEAAASAGSYDVVKGSLGTLRSKRSFTPSVLGCLVNDGAAARRASDSATPSAGQGFWYLVRGVRAGVGPGSYATGDAGEAPERDAQIAAASSRCP